MLWLYDIAGSYQSGFSVPTAKREGYAGGISKITEGLSSGAGWDITNKNWSKRWHDESVTEGQVWGGYHYLHRGNGAAQARYFVDEMDKITGHGCDGCLVQLDNESDADWQTTVDWSNEFYRLTHDHPYLMYTGSWWWNVPGRQWNGNSLTPYLWHSHYVAGSGYASSLYQNVTPDFWTPNYGNWSRATILQFSAKGSLGGIDANVDVNAIDMPIQTLLGGSVTMSGEADAVFSRPYTGYEPWVNGQSWAAQAIEKPLVNANAKLETLVNSLGKTAPVVLDAAAEQRIIDGVAAKVLAAINKPHSYSVTQTG